MHGPAERVVSEDLLDEALEESFPASDPLPFWSGGDAGVADEPTGPAEVVE